MTAWAGNNPDADTAEQWERAKSSVLLTQQSSFPGKEPATADRTQGFCSQIFWKGKIKKEKNELRFPRTGVGEI